MRIYLIAICLLWLVPLSAQGDLQEAIQSDVPTEKVTEIRNKLQYEDTKWALRLRKEPTPEEDIEEEINNGNISPGLKSFLSLLFYILIVVGIMLLVLGLVYLLNPTMLKNEKIEPLKAKDGHQLEDITIIDPNELLSEALEKGNYRGAVRALFLRNLQYLDNNKLINWKSYKTNRDYLYELSSYAKKAEISWMINIYERIWYGNTPIDADVYNAIEPRYSSLINQDPLEND